MIEGVKINLNGADYIVPALSIGGLKATREDRKLLSEVNPEARDLTDEQLAAFMHYIWVALRRNYPDVTLDQMDELIDQRNLPLVVAAINAQTGLTNGTGSGEAKPR